MSLTLEFQENVAVLTHDDGKRNVFSPDAIRDFNEALDEVEAKSASLMWLGREGCFSAGFDLKVISSGMQTLRQPWSKPVVNWHLGFSPSRIPLFVR